MSPRSLDPATVHARLRNLEDLLEALELLGGVSGDQLRRDVVTRLAAERVLTQLVDLVVAVCSHLAAAQGARSPSTYREAVEETRAAGVIDAELAASLSAAVGVRNLLVHHDGRVDLDIVAAALPRAGRDITAFIGSVAAWLADADD